MSHVDRCNVGFLGAVTHPALYSIRGLCQVMWNDLHPELFIKRLMERSDRDTCFESVQLFFGFY